MGEPTDVRDPAGATVRDGRSTRWDPHRRERRATIIRAAIEAIDTVGPEALTGQIAELAGVPRTHVYRHFDGKSALDLAVSTQVANQIGERLRSGLATVGSTRDIISAAVEAHLTWIEEHPNLYRFLAAHAYLVTTPDSAGAGRDAKAVFAAELTAFVQRYLHALGVEQAPVERVVVGVVGLVDATATWWLERRDPTRAELTAELADHVAVIMERSAREWGLDLRADQPLPAL